MKVLSQANTEFKQGNHQTALTLYKMAAKIYGPHLVSANIKACEKALAKNNNNTTPDNPEAFINSYFDEIYLVNLTQEVDRRITAAFQLEKHGIKYKLTEAVNGYHEPVLTQFKEYQERPLGSLSRYKEFNQREIKRGSHFIESPGALGYIHTYISILKQAKSAKHSRILILEDDVILHPNFHAKLFKFISSVDQEWKVIQLGASQYNWDSVNESEALSAGHYHPRRLDTCGSFAIAIDSSVFDELIEAQSAFEAPFDHLPLGEVYEQHLGKCFVAYPNIVMPDVGESSIRNSRDQKTHSDKMRWKLNEFRYPIEKPTIAIQVTSIRNLKYLENFDEPESQPFRIKLYIYGSDGVRPVHSAASLTLSVNSDITDTPTDDAPEAEFHAFLDKAETLTESGIRNFIENQLLSKSLHTNLKPKKVSKKGRIKDRVSIVIPTYKRPENLARAIESVINQDYPDIELIVVSDNEGDSPDADESASTVRSISAKYTKSNIKFIQHRVNRNGSAARNTGFLQSTGEFICFLDDDDVYLDGRISNSIQALKDAPISVGAVYCGFLGWNSPQLDDSRFKTGDLTREILFLDYKAHYLHTNTATYRASAISSLNGFDETFRRHQDLEFNLRFFEQYEIGGAAFPGVRLNPAPSSISNKVFNQALLEIKKKFLKRFQDTISKLDPQEQDSVYKIHWDEVIKYTRDKAAVISHIADQKHLPEAQILIALTSNNQQNQ